MRQLLQSVIIGLENKPSKKIYIQVDADTDGFTSSAILYEFISSISNCEIEIGIHEGKEHGLDLKEALASNANLIIVPDASGNPEDYKTLKKKMIIIPSLKIKLGVFFSRFLPYRLLLKIVYRIQVNKQK